MKHKFILYPLAWLLALAGIFVALGVGLVVLSAIGHYFGVAAMLLAPLIPIAWQEGREHERRRR